MKLEELLTKEELEKLRSLSRQLFGEPSLPADKVLSCETIDEFNYYQGKAIKDKSPTEVINEASCLEVALDACPVNHNRETSSNTSN